MKDKKPRIITAEIITVARSVNFKRDIVYSCHRKENGKYQNLVSELL